jgi:hypothetical protein
VRRLRALAAAVVVVVSLHAAETADAHAPSVRLGKRMAFRRGWTGYEWTSLWRLWQLESRWDPWARNPSSGACGIPQAINCPYGLGARHAREQISWGIRYISARYSRPSVAWAFERAHGYY